MAFVLGCVADTILGVLVLACIPSLHLTILNLVFFVVGAFLATPVFLFVYGQIFARNQLRDAAFVGLFPVLLVGGVSGGAIVVWLKGRFTKHLFRPPSLH
jgi:hypothetical protein